MKDSELLEIMELCGHFLYHRRGGKRGQNKILRLLEENGEVNQKELQRMMDIKSGSISEQMIKMENNGLISRKKHEDDKRNIVVNITEEGLKCLNEDRQRLERQNQMLFDSLSFAEKEELYDMLNKLLSYWKKNFDAELFEHRKNRSKV